MIVGGLIGALVPSSYKWAYFTGSCVALFFVLYVLLGPARTTAKLIGYHAHSAYVSSMLVLAGLWLLYPVGESLTLCHRNVLNTKTSFLPAWGLCEGGNVISTNAEAVFYGCLDLLAKPCFLLFQ